MTLFDIIAIGVIAVSALAASSRGAVYELVSFIAVALSALTTVAVLPMAASLARHVLHLGWLSPAVAAVATFVVVFVLLRYLSSSLTRSIGRDGFVGNANRFGGAVIGGVRGLVCLGLFALVFNRATPMELRPRWITDAKLYPIASASGRTLQTMIPKGFRVAEAFTPAAENAASGDGGESPDATSERSTITPPGERHRTDLRSERAKMKDRGYTKRARESIDALVEKSR